MDKSSSLHYNDTHIGCLFPINAQSVRCGEDEYMSFVCTYVAEDGLAVIGDTRRTVCYSDGRVEYHNDTKKIYRIPERNILAVLTGGCRFGENEEKTFDDVLSFVHGRHIHKIANQIIQTITELGFTQEIEVGLYQTDFYGEHCKVKRVRIDLDPNGTAGMDECTLPPHSFYFQGEDYKEIGFIDSGYRKVKMLDSAIEYMRKRMEVVILAEKENAIGLKTVGGDCDLHVIRWNEVEHQMWTPVR